MLKLLGLTAEAGVPGLERPTGIPALTAATCAAISHTLPVIIAPNGSHLSSYRGYAIFRTSQRRVATVWHILN